VKSSVAPAVLFSIIIVIPIHATGDGQAPRTSSPARPGEVTTAAKAPSAPAKPAKGENVGRLEPSEVPDLPAEFVEKLNARGCTIPQFDPGDQMMKSMRSGASNIIHGEFARRGQEDWAVLCSNGKTSTIVIFWGKATACPASLARLDDAHYLKPGKDKKLHYSRSIRPLGESDLGDRAGIASLRPLQHQGIDDRFIGKSSAFFYCNEGKWRIFPAKDSIFID
jgi:hypothetical protein